MTFPISRTLTVLPGKPLEFLRPVKRSKTHVVFRAQPFWSIYNFIIVPHYEQWRLSRIAQSKHPIYWVGYPPPLCWTECSLRNHPVFWTGSLLIRSTSWTGWAHSSPHWVNLSSTVSATRYRNHCFNAWIPNLLRKSRKT